MRPKKVLFGRRVPYSYGSETLPGPAPMESVTLALPSTSDPLRVRRSTGRVCVLETLLHFHNSVDGGSCRSGTRGY